MQPIVYLGVLLGILTPSASAQGYYHGAGNAGVTLGGSYAFLTGDDGATYSAEVVGTLSRRLDVSASYAGVGSGLGRGDAWAAAVVGTAYPFVAPDGWLGLSVGGTLLDGRAGDEIGIVYGVNMAGVIDATAVTLVPQLSIGAATPLGDGGDTSFALGLALGLAAVDSSPSLAFEPFASVGITPGVFVVGAALRLVVSG